MKKEGIIRIFLLIIILFNSTSALAIRINEVELNPAGDDKGNEFVELYSKEEINLSGFKLVNGDNENFILDNFSSFNGYLAIVFPKQWLDNSNESVSLFDGSKLIDKTEIFADSKNNENTWNFCSYGWDFLEGSEGEENNCIEEEIKENQTVDSINSGETQNEGSQNNAVKTAPNNEKNSDINNITVEASISKNNSQYSNIKPVTAEIIRLNPQSSATQASKDIKSNQILYKSKTEIIKEYAIYLYAALCTFALIFIIIKRR